MVVDTQSILTFSERYGLKFYASFVAQLAVLMLLFKTQNAFLCMSFVSFYNVIGNYLPLPVDTDRERQIAKAQNNNKYLLGPLIYSCLSTPAIMLIVWNYYHLLPLNSATEILLTLSSISFVISASIDAAHQLLHRPQPICKFFAYLNLFFLQFTIYPTEHLYLHHKKVGTPQDPITSPKNRSVFVFYFNALFSCYKFNFNYSKQIFTFNLVSTLLMNLILIVSATKQGSGINKALFFIGWIYLTLFIMEVIQYIQHYGLVYRNSQKAKPIIEISSWNANQNELLNWFVFRFQRHSDHHMNAYKIYPTLDLTDKMPLFPFDFVSGMLIAIIPPLWYYIMNPLADQIVLQKPASKQHKKFVQNVVIIVRFLLFIGFPMRVLPYLLS